MLTRFTKPEEPPTGVKHTRYTPGVEITTEGSWEGWVRHSALLALYYTQTRAMSVLVKFTPQQ